MREITFQVGDRVRATGSYSKLGSGTVVVVADGLGFGTPWVGVEFDQYNECLRTLCKRVKDGHGGLFVWGESLELLERGTSLQRRARDEQ